VVSFTPRPLHPEGKRPLYLLDRRLSAPQSRSQRRGEEKIRDPFRNQSLYRLCYPGCTLSRIEYFVIFYCFVNCLFYGIIIMSPELFRIWIRKYSKINSREIEWIGTNWIILAQDEGQRLALVNVVINLQRSWVTGGFSRRTQFHVLSKITLIIWCAPLDYGTPCTFVCVKSIFVLTVNVILA
jgi:hypothetical protein